MCPFYSYICEARRVHTTMCRHATICVRFTTIYVGLEGYILYVSEDYDICIRILPSVSSVASLAAAGVVAGMLYMCPHTAI